MRVIKLYHEHLKVVDSREVFCLQDEWDAEDYWKKEYDGRFYEFDIYVVYNSFKSEIEVPFQTNKNKSILHIKSNQEFETALKAAIAFNTSESKVKNHCYKIYSNKKFNYEFQFTQPVNHYNKNRY